MSHPSLEVHEARVRDEVGTADVLAEAAPVGIRLDHNQGDPPTVLGAVVVRKRVPRREPV